MKSVNRSSAILLSLFCVCVLISTLASPSFAAIGANKIVNGGPSAGIGWSAEGYEPTSDSDPYGIGPNNNWRHYYLRGIDHWKVSRDSYLGVNQFTTLFDYNTQQSDLSYMNGDRYTGFMQLTEANGWGNSNLVIQINRKVRTVLEMDVNCGVISGTDMKYASGFSGDPDFGRMACSTHANMNLTNGNAITVDVDWWQTNSTKNWADTYWWFLGTGSYGEPANEYYPKLDANSGVFVLPIQGMREAPETFAKDKWVKVYVDLSWCYEWMLFFNRSSIQNGSSYTFMNPPQVWRAFWPIEGCNLKCKMYVKNIMIRDWDLKDTATRSTYTTNFNANSNTAGRSYPYNAHWSDYIQNLYD